MRRVYIETTIPSYLTARPSGDLIRAADQLLTREWWDRRGEFELFVSAVVFDECSRGDAVAAAARLASLTDLNMLSSNEEIADLITRLIRDVPLPASAQVDASHIAIATIHRMDYLLTWNCRHIANPVFERRIRELCNAAGYNVPILCTPRDFFDKVPQ